MMISRTSSSETLRKIIRSEIEAILFHRVVARRIEGYTLETAQEIAEKLEASTVIRALARQLPVMHEAFTTFGIELEDRIETSWDEVWERWGKR